MLELMVVLVTAGVLSGLSIGKISDIIAQQRVAKAAAAITNDLQQAFARQRQHVLVQVGIGALILGRAVAIAFERGMQVLVGALVHQIAHVPR